MGNFIHPTAIIDKEVILGSGNWIGPYVVIMGNVEIGNDNWIGPHVVIGAPPEHRSFHEGVNIQPRSGKIVIGSGNVVHEHAAIQAPTADLTLVGDNCFLMHGVHIAHDVKLSDAVTIAPGTVMGGHSSVGKRGTLGIGVAVHQFRSIGPLAMVGMNSTIVKDVQPFSLVAGTPARHLKPNLIGIERSGIPLGSWLDLIDTPFDLWPHSDVPIEVWELLDGWNASNEVKH